MSNYLSLHDGEQIAEDSAPIVKPGLARVFVGVMRNPVPILSEALAHPIQSYAMIFAAAGGVYWALNVAIAESMGPALSFPMLLAAVVLIGIPAGIGYLFALAILLEWSCDILGAEVGRKRIRMILAYAGVPGIIALVLFGLPRLLIFGQSLLMPERSWMTSNPVLVWGLWFGDAVCFAWSLWLIIKALKLGTGFSTGKSMMAAALPLIPILLIGGLFILIAGAGLFNTPAW